MIKRIRGRFAAPATAAVILVLAGCSGGDEAQVPAPDEGSAQETGTPAPSPSATASAPPQAACEATAPTICAGPMLATIQNVTLQWRGDLQRNGDRMVAGSVTLSLQARGTQPVQLALLNEDISLSYKNGIVLTLDQHDDEDVSGLAFCGFDGPDCVANNRSPFTTFTPGDSPVQVTFQFEGRAKSSEISSMAMASTADFTMRAWAIDSDPQGRAVTISVAGSPVQNATLQ